MALFNAISPLNGGTLGTYYQDRNYPIDLNGAQDYMRPQLGMPVYPFPVVIGSVQGLVPCFDGMVFSTMLGKNPYGPYIGQGPRNLGGIFPDLSGGMAKVGG
jgi:hypothetical protein